jgi:regulator of protease activity HflC (stomatin/prohibitin superfamily)
MKLIIFLGIVLVLIILFFIACFKKIKYDEVYVYERFGKVKLAKEGRAFIIPFVDKVKSHLVIKDEIHSTMLNECTLSNGIIVQYKLTVFYDVLDPIKVTYEIKDMDSEIDEVIKQVFPEIIKDMSLDDIVKSEKKIVGLAKDNMSKLTEGKGYVVTEMKIDNIMEKTKYIGDIEI